MSSQLLFKVSDTLFRKYGIKSVTMADIAKELGMSKKTIYKYVDNKNDLVAQIMENHIINDKKANEEISLQAKNALDQLLQIFIYIQGILKGMNTSLLYDLQKYYNPIWQKWENFHQEYVLDITIKNLKRGQEEGIYRKDMNVDLMARLYISFLPVFSAQESFLIKDYSTYEVHKEFMKYHINGIISKKGKEALQELLLENNLDLSFI